MKTKKTAPFLQATWQERPRKGSLEYRYGLLGTAAVAFLVFLSRLTRLGSIKDLVFDETYYVKDAYSLIKRGYEVQWPKEYDDTFISGNFTLPVDGAFVAHPSLGKWLIGAGIQLLGDNPWGWRIAACLAGSIAAFLLGRIIWHLWGSWPMAMLGVVLMGVDGEQIAMSRTSVLDIFLEMFILLGVLFVVRDQNSYRPRLMRELLATHELRRTARVAKQLRVTMAKPKGRFARQRWNYGPALWWRPWLFAAGLAFGCAMSVKWSGLYPVAAFGIFVFIRELTARWSTEKRWISSAMWAGGFPAFLNLVPISFVVYILSWTGWALHPKAWGHNGTGLLSEWISYHLQLITFHTTLVADHPYKANPWGWLLQLRPTSFYYEKVGGNCAGQTCVQTVNSLGNPLLWWIGVLALALVVVATARFLDWRAGLIVTGYCATWMPWLIYADRTIFTFYTVVLTPFVVLSLIYVLGVMRGEWRVAREKDWVARAGLIPAPWSAPQFSCATATVLLVVIIGTGIFFFPIWTGMPIPADQFYWRMWLPSWI